MHPLARSLGPAAALLAVGVLSSGCQAYSAYRFGPSPQVQELRLTERDPPFALADVAALGIADGPDERPEVRFRLRLQNPGEEPLRLLAEELLLLDAHLSPLDPPRVTPADVGLHELGPGATLELDLAFPLPSGLRPRDLPLDGLSLRWAVESSGEVRRATLVFQRLFRGYCYVHEWGPCPWGPYPVGYGYPYGSRYWR